MRLSTRAALALLFALGLAGSAQAGFSIEFPRGPDPAVRAWPEWADQTACGGIPFDPVAAFGGETVAESGAGAPETALREFLASPLGSVLPQRFWRLVTLSEARAEFASGRLEQNVYWLVFELGAGGWRVGSERGECRPRTTRDGVLSASWTLAAQEGLSRKSNAVEVRIRAPEGCNGGRRLNPAAEPEFRSVRKKLVLTIMIKPLPPGTYTCEGVVEPPLRIDLPGGRLGKRSLWDGSVYPPRRRLTPRP